MSLGSCPKEELTPEVPSAGAEDAVQKVLRWPETALQAPDHVAGSTPLPRDAGFAGLRWPPSACTVPWPTINLTPWPIDPVLEILSSRFAPPPPLCPVPLLLPGGTCHPQHLPQGLSFS